LQWRKGLFHPKLRQQIIHREIQADLQKNTSYWKIIENYWILLAFTILKRFLNSAYCQGGF
jgi:hypothetical protein